MSFITEPARALPVYGEFDVVVTGGGQRHRHKFNPHALVAMASWHTAQRFSASCAVQFFKPPGASGPGIPQEESLQ